MRCSFPVVVLAALAACKGGNVDSPSTGAAAPTHSVAAAPSLAASAAPSASVPPARPTAPTPAAPDVVTIDDLPARSEDGAKVAFLRSENERGADEDNLTLQIYDVARDRVVDSLPVRRVATDDTKAMDARKAAANAVLAKAKWVKLLALDGAPDETLDAGDDEPLELKGERIVVRYVEPELTIDALAGGGAHLFARAMPSWVEHPKCPASPGTRWTGMLEEGWADEDAKLLVVRLTFRGGNDSCWEPEDGVVHVLRWR